ncbi:MULTISPECIES: hypothetical protein [unclassified Paenibacillus]|nr:MULTISPECIES: hypothetical protein [unclassified Paenibacillus]
MVIPVLKGIDIIEIQDDLKGSKLRGTAYIAEEDDSGSVEQHSLFKILS